MELPRGVELFTFDPAGEVLVRDEHGVSALGPGPDLLRFADDGQFARYFIGDAKTSPERPATPPTSSAWSPRTRTAASTSCCPSGTPPAGSTTPSAAG